MLPLLLLPLILFSNLSHAQTQKYIIKFKKGANQDTLVKRILGQSSTLFGQSSGLSPLVTPGRVHYRYTPTLFNGVAGEFDPISLKQFTLVNRGMIEYVELDAKVWALGTQSPAPWNLARLSSPTAPSTTFTYDNNAGSNVTLYVIDTGVDITHKDFQGRAINGKNFVNTETFADLNGHGTHCAGIAGGLLYGVAKKLKIVSVKALDKSGGGTISTVVAALNWVIQVAKPGASIVSLSLGANLSPSLNDIVAQAASKKIAVAVAAGNSNGDACNFSPASSSGSFTVGAITNTDAKASYSNTGTCVKLYAPGSSITSDYPNNTTKVLSGTSMAAPHAAGVMAVLMSQRTYLTTNILYDDVVKLAVRTTGGLKVLHF